MGRRVAVVVLLGLAVLAWSGRTSGARACSCSGDGGPHRVFVGQVVEEVDPAPPDEPWGVSERTYRFSVEDSSGGEELIQVTTGAESACGIDPPVVGARYRVSLPADREDASRVPHVSLCSGSLAEASPLDDAVIAARQVLSSPDASGSRPLLASVLAAAMAVTAFGLGAVALVGHVWPPKAPSRADSATKSDQ